MQTKQTPMVTCRQCGAEKPKGVTCECVWRARIDAMMAKQPQTSGSGLRGKGAAA